MIQAIDLLSLVSIMSESQQVCPTFTAGIFFKTSQKSSFFAQVL